MLQNPFCNLANYISKIILIFRKRVLTIQIIQRIFLLLLLVPLTAQVDYDSEIQPIFNSKCIQCHGSSAGLNLSSYANIMQGSMNGDVIIPYDHAASELWKRVNSGQMPPGNNDLTNAQVNLIAQWIDEGALPEASTSSCDEGYTYIEDIPDNLVNANNEGWCFFNDDLAVIDGLITLNNLNYSNLLETGVQSWNTGRLVSWVLTYTPNGSNGVNQQLTVLPENIGNLTSLASLYMEWNYITVLPESFSALTNLFNLVISNNLLTSLPEDFGNLTNLFFLDLGYNQISSIPESIGDLPNIMYFWIFNNQLSQLPESVCNLPLIWDGMDYANYPYFASGGNQLCDSNLIPDCVENSSNFEISLDQFYYSFIQDSPQDCPDDALVGDLNDDGILNVLDIVLMVNMVLDDGYDGVADMNGDGVINVLDIVTLINTILS